MGNDQTKPTTASKIAKACKAVSPATPKTKRVRRTPKSTKTPAPKFDWLACYTPTPQTPNPQALPSEYLFEDFVLHTEQVLGEGAFAQVIMATHRPSRVKSAVKVITKKSIPQDMRDYVVKEPGVLAQLHHKNVVKLLCVHEDKNFIYMFLKYLPGGDLHSRLERDGVVYEDLAKIYFRQIIDATDFVHKKGFCHRDLKLENLLIIGEDKQAQIIMIDFGFAAEMHPTEKFQDFPGSVSYAAPELLKGIPYKGNSADVYSLGVILFTMVEGMYPFYDEDRQEMFRQITTCRPEFNVAHSPELEDLLHWMLQKNPENRPTLDQIKSHPFLGGTKPVTPLKSTVSKIKKTAIEMSPKNIRRRSFAF